MKKLIKILIILIIVVGGIFFAYRYFLSGKSSFQSIYLIPPDAAIIIESNAAFDAWNNIVHSQAWDKISNIPSLAEFDKEISGIDSMLSEKSFLLKLLGRRKIMVSMHEYEPNEYDYLYIINIGKLALLKKPEKLLSNLLGKNFPLTKRMYNGTTIYELLDIESGELYIFSFLKEKLIFSTNYILVEASIDEPSKMTLGRDIDFIDVSKRISGRGLFDVYLNYKYLVPLLESTLGKSSEFIDELNTSLHYSAFSFDISPEGMITLEGYSSVVDSVPSFYNSVAQASEGSLQSAAIIPARVASMVKISIDDAIDYYRNSLDNLGNSEREEYQKTLAKIEKKFKFSIEDNFLSWIDNEIVLLQTQPSNLGRTNEFAAIIAAKNKRDHKKNLDFISKQIERNSPVKIREVAYEGYTISYISFPGLIKALFGKMLGDIEKPYFTIIDRYVILSNHPQTLKNIIDDHIAGNTLEYSTDFQNFTGEFKRKSSAMIYFDIPVLFRNIKQFVDGETWLKLQENKPYITCFPKAGIQLNGEADLIHLLVKAKYSDEVEEFTEKSFDPFSFIKLFSDVEIDESAKKNENWYDPDIIIHDLDKTSQEEKFENGSIRYSIGLKHGLLHGQYKEYYPDGTLKVKGRFKQNLQDGSWKLYDEEENLIEERLFIDGKEENE